MLFQNCIHLYTHLDTYKCSVYIITANINRLFNQVKNMHFPGIHPETAEWLVSQRQLAAVAIDAPSVDHGFSKKFDSQRIFLSGNVYLINNVDHVWTLPPASATAFVFPMKIKHAAVVPIRLMALVP